MSAYSSTLEIGMGVSPGVQLEPLPHLDGILPAGEVHLWQVDLTAWDQRANELLQLLDPEERARAERFKFPVHRNQFLISRALLRRALGHYLGVEGREVRFRTTANGKPELAAKSDSQSIDLRFNLSHTEGVTIFVFAHQRQLGVDVERIRPDTNAMELAERFFSAQEVKWLRSQPASERVAAFFTCWTGKEAYIKAHGEGLSMSLSSFEVLPVPTPDGFKLQLQVYGEPQETKRWSMRALQLGEGLRAALAVEGQHCRVCFGQWPSPGTETP